MPHYLRLGPLPPKRHIRHARPDGAGFAGEGMYYEQVVSTAGFGQEYAILYHLRPPTRVRSVEPAGRAEVERVAEPALRHHHLRTAALARAGDPVTGRVPLLANDDVTLWRARPAGPQATLYRNGGADELLYVHAGAGTLETQYGRLPYRAMDYLVIPRATTYRLVPDEPAAEDHLILESPGIVRVPRRYTNAAGQMILGAPYGERDLHGPAGPLTLDREEDTPVLVKDGPRLTRHVLAHHPFDVIGWDGCLYPFRFHAMDFEPITGTVHQPPPIHQTFEADGFVVCTFAPRVLDTHPQAIKVPYAHSNPHADEVLFYSRGNFGSRRGVEAASVTLHPRGLPHGPHPGTIAAARDAVRTDELAVMMDTERPLFLTPQAMRLDDPAYPLSWL
jgi:homogentisate 1,2-dioxygenase